MESGSLVFDTIHRLLTTEFLSLSWPYLSPVLPCAGRYFLKCALRYFQPNICKTKLIFPQNPFWLSSILTKRKAVHLPICISHQCLLSLSLTWSPPICGESQWLYFCIHPQSPPLLISSISIMVTLVQVTTNFHLDHPNPLLCFDVCPLHLFSQVAKGILWK